MSKYTLPDNCEIELFDDEQDSKSFRLWFHGEGEPYISEIYGVFDGETVEEAALAICQRFGWIENPPNKES